MFTLLGNPHSSYLHLVKLRFHIHEAVTPDSLFPSAPGSQHSTFSLEYYIWVVPRINGVVCYFSFCDWLISLSIKSSRFIHTAVYTAEFPFLRLNIPFDVYTCILLIHTLVDWYLGCFHVLTILNNTAMNMDVETFIQDSAFNSFGYTPTSGIAGSYSNCIFNSLRNWPKKKIYFPKKLNHFTSPSTVHNGSNFFTSLPTLAIFCFPPILYFLLSNLYYLLLPSSSGFSLFFF